MFVKISFKLSIDVKLYNLSFYTILPDDINYFISTIRKIEYARVSFFGDAYSSLGFWFWFYLKVLFFGIGKLL